MAPILELQTVSARYGHVRALESVDLTLREGQLIQVLGPNGAGKSTLLRAVAGLTRCTGRIHAMGSDVTRRAAHRRAREGVVLVPEGRGVLPGLTVRENLQVAQAARGRRGGEAIDVLEVFPRLRERLWQDCSSLSGGEMQMLAIARAIEARPRVLLLDEPSLGLAPQMVAEVYNALQLLSESGLPMVLVEQKSVPLWAPPAETIVLRSGRVAHRIQNQTISSEALAELYMGGGGGENDEHV